MKPKQQGVISPMEKRFSWPLFSFTIVLIFLLYNSYNMGYISSLQSTLCAKQASNRTNSNKVVKKTSKISNSTIPRFAYFISGSKGDLNSLLRTLKAIYHPRNVYLLHLDLETPFLVRRDLILRVKNDKVLSKIGNVHVIKKANIVTYKGPTMVANTLHACAILLRKHKNWDWFINLSASDYPLMTQDDLMHAFSTVPRNLNFLEHTSKLGWKEGVRGRPIIVDPGLYSSKKSDVFWASQKRELPTSFNLFTGSAWVVLSREFIEYTIWGYDNLPRTLLMYYSNFVSSPEAYFQTVICNSPFFSKTVVNHDLHYISWDNPPKQHPNTLNSNHIPKMIASGAPFARKFNHGDVALNTIDSKFLTRVNDGYVPGGWCKGTPLCTQIGDVDNIRPGNGSVRLDRLFDRIVRSEDFRKNQCK